MPFSQSLQIISLTLLVEYLLRDFVSSEIPEQGFESKPAAYREKYGLPLAHWGHESRIWNREL